MALGRQELGYASIEKFEPRDLGPRNWGQELLIAHTPHYIGKVLRMKAGTMGGLQYHREKDETFYLLEGYAVVGIDDGPGMAHRWLNFIEMWPGQAYHIPPGAVHQVKAVTDCLFFEVSTPHFDDRVRCEKDYGLPETGGLPTTEAPSHEFWGV